MLIRGGANTTLLGGSLSRRRQRPGRKNSLSQRPCVCYQGEAYNNRGLRLWLTYIARIYGERWAPSG